MLQKLLKSTLDFIKGDFLLPTVLIIIYLVFIVIARGVVPTSDELIQLFSGLYQRYGYEIIFIASFLEALILVNLFTPGQVAMAMGAVFARSGQTELAFVIITASLGALCGYMIDFLMGKFGFADVIKKMGYGIFLSQAKIQIKKFGKRGIVLGFFHTNIGSFVSIVCGALDIDFFKFLILSGGATLVWMSMWGVAIYLIGDIVLMIASRYGFLIMFFIVIIMIISGILKNKTHARS